METIRVRCCVAGGGPAGMMLGYLLARAGVDVVVLEKHADFLRDFRGDTVHPSTLEVMGELGLLDEFLQRPHTEIRQFSGQVNGVAVPIADMRHLRVRCPFIALMPQWDFLNFLAEHAARYPTFALRMRTAADDLIVENGRVAGVRASGPNGPVEVRADLVVAADGRHSVLRERAGLEVRDLGAPIDVLWMRLSRHEDDPTALLGYFDAGRLFVTLNRGDYWQCALVIPKGGYDAVRARGLDALRDDIATIVPFLRERTAELRDWDDVKLLTVVVDRLERWYRGGLLCIGDAAHAMSPMGGVGINLAIQDAVAAANILAAPLRTRTVSLRHLAAVQRRRVFAIRVTQAGQVFAADRIFRNVAIGRPARSAPRGRLPLIARLFQAFPPLRRLPARFIALGVRPEHVRTPELPPAGEGPAG
jgi:2-polyprenyl-6-methoxyphenol hydroxylase-like FAD-dependent oxidoreductase